MSGNIPVVTTTFEAGLQAKINAVDGSTPIEDIIALVRSGELITSVDNTPIQTELQLRMDAVDSNTDAETYIELAAAIGKVDNTIPSLVENITLSTPLIQARVSAAQVYIGNGSPLIITPPEGSRIKLTLLTSTDQALNIKVKIGDKDIMTGTLMNSQSQSDQAVGVPSRFYIGRTAPRLTPTSNYYLQHTDLAVEPMLGGIDEPVKVSSTAGIKLIYSYEVWK